MTRRLAALVALAAALVVALPAAPAAAAAPGVHYVGKLKGSDAFVAVVRKGERVRAYVCDGRPRRTSLALWFKDRLRNGAFTVTSAGVRLDATVHRRAAIGSVLLADDRRFEFRAVRVTRRGGLLERTDRIDGRSLHSGWIALPDGRVRGRTTDAGTPSLDGSTPVTGPGILIEFTEPPPSDTEQLLAECKALREDLKAYQNLLGALMAQKPVHPGSTATHKQLETYFARLSTWRAAVDDTLRKIEAVKARIKRTCG